MEVCKNFHRSLGLKVHYFLFFVWVCFQSDWLSDATELIQGKWQASGQSPADSLASHKLRNCASVWHSLGLSDSCESLTFEVKVRLGWGCWESKEIFSSLLACRLVLRQHVLVCLFFSPQFLYVHGPYIKEIYHANLQVKQRKVRMNNVAIQYLQFNRMLWRKKKQK